MRLRLSRPGFLRDERGAAMSDWILLGAALIGVSAAVSTAVRNGTLNLEQDIGGMLETSAAVMNAVLEGSSACPTIESTGHTVSWTEHGACHKDLEGYCDPSTLHVIASYRLDNGEEWTLNYEQTEGALPLSVWYDARGAVVDPPCSAG
jgi:hypothetical protein